MSDKAIIALLSPYDDGIQAFEMDKAEMLIASMQAGGQVPCESRNQLSIDGQTDFHSQRAGQNAVI